MIFQAILMVLYFIAWLSQNRLLFQMYHCIDVHFGKFNYNVAICNSHNKGCVNRINHYFLEKYNLYLNT